MGERCAPVRLFNALAVACLFLESRVFCLGEPLAVFVAWAVVVRPGAPFLPPLAGASIWGEAKGRGA